MDSIKLGLFVIVVFFLSSCQHIQENVQSVRDEDSVPDSSFVNAADSVISDSVAFLSKDSVRIKLHFKDFNGKNIHAPVPVQICFHSVFENKYTNDKGFIDTIIGLNDFQIVLSKDTFYYPVSDYAGDTLKEDFILPIRFMKGRIMENDGTPLSFMPLHIHSKFKEKGKKDVESFDDDFIIQTDSFGYYRTYVPENVFRVSIRTCGFLVGFVSRHELLTYPTQNFLFVPYEFRNLCGERTPVYSVSITLPDLDISIPTDIMSEFFTYDDVLESAESVILVAERGNSTLRKKISKRSGIFRNTVFSICMHD